MEVTADNLTYAFCTVDDWDDVFEFYEHEFIPREPMAMGLGMTLDDQREFVILTLDASCSCEATVIARDPAKDNKLVGIRLCKFTGKDSGNIFQKIMDESTGKLRVFLGIACKVAEGVNLFKDETVDKILEYTSLGVAEGYGGRGIGNRMCEMSLKRGKELGAQYTQVVCTNIKTQGMFQKQGFEVQGSIDYATYEVDGERVFDTTRMGDSTCIQLMIKKL